jgi:hypothetical protein
MHTRPIRPHQTKKKRSAIANHSDTVVKALSTNISIVLIELVYLQKNGSNIPIMGFSLTSPYNGLFTNIPLVGFSLTSSYMQHKQQNNSHKQKRNIRKS